MKGATVKRKGTEEHLLYNIQHNTATAKRFTTTAKTMTTTPPQPIDSGPNRHNIQHNTATANRFRAQRPKQ